jgi:hypothetical protein
MQCVVQAARRCGVDRIDERAWVGTGKRPLDRGSMPSPSSRLSLSSSMRAVSASSRVLRVVARSYHSK